ncbi:MAG: glutathione S-transferase [Betaproteobacteria bacterium]|nr:glutathione S-transferase [Betaproteobacteria bacterium]
MPFALFSHPFASYCQKALIALYENETPFSHRLLDQADPATFAEFEKLWPLKRFPVLLDDGRAIAEATIIIEHLDLHHPGRARMIPADPKVALECASSTDFSITTCIRRCRRSSPTRYAHPRSAMRVAWPMRMRRWIPAYAWLEQRMTGRE